MSAFLHYFVQHRAANGIDFLGSVDKFHVRTGMGLGGVLVNLFFRSMISLSRRLLRVFLGGLMKDGLLCCLTVTLKVDKESESYIFSC